jgi:putative hemolysin
MITTFSGIRSKTAWLAPVLAVLLVSACAPQHSAPTQTSSTNPTVTYKYRGDEELMQASEKANAYCAQYHATAQTYRIDTESDGSRTAVFQCVALPTNMASAQVYNPNYPYNDNTDQDLLGVTQSADLYCANSGGQRAVTTINTDINGTKTITFRCVPR